MSAKGELREKASDRVKEPKQYNVIMINDDFTTMEFVVMVLVEIFKKDPATAEQLMLDIGGMLAGTQYRGDFEKRFKSVLRMSSGLELDYTCLLWDADMRIENGEWHYYRFSRNTEWTELIANSESKQEQMKYMLNAYRVLLTRARAGMIICVPKGNANKTISGFWEDSTRLPEYYDGTYRYFKSLGLKEI